MELSNPKQIQTQETKQRIYQAALEILETKGFAYLTVNNICKVAKVSNGSFFHHFRTKDDLLSDYIYKQFAQYRQENHFDEAVNGRDYEERILIFYDYWADYMTSLGVDFVKAFYHTNNYSLDVRRWYQREPISIWNYSGECIMEAKKQGRLKDDLDPEHCIVMLAAIVKGVLFDWSLSGGGYDISPRIRELMCPYLKSIRAENG